MRKRKRLLRITAYLFLLAALFAPACIFRTMKVFASEGIDHLQKCSVTFEIPGTYREALEDKEIAVRLYRIQDMTEDTFPADVTAQDLKNMAETQSALLKVRQWEDVPETQPDYEIRVVHNQGTQANMLTGVYLVCMRPIQVENVTYEALPYIVCLPNPMPIQDGKENWVYDLKVDLKLGENTKSGPPTQDRDDKEEEDPPFRHRTGDDIPIGGMLAGVAVAGALYLLCLLLSKRREKKNGFHRETETVISVMGIFRNIFAAAGIVLLTIVVMVGIRYYQEQKEREAVNRLVMVSSEEASEQPKEPETESIWTMCDRLGLPKIDFQQLKSINEDSIGWIYACNGEINAPVVVSDGEYYLRRSIEKEASRSGTIYAYSKTTEPLEQERMILFGHNMRDGSMFHPLLQYWQNSSYAAENPYVYFITEDNLYQYEVHSVTVKEFEDIDFVEKDVPTETKTLDLITCEYSGKDTRLIVEANLKEMW